MVLYYHVTQYRNYPTLKQIFYPRSFHGRHFRSLLYPAHHTKPNIGSKNIVKGNHFAHRYNSERPQNFRYVT